MPRKTTPHKYNIVSPLVERSTSHESEPEVEPTFERKEEVELDHTDSVFISSLSKNESVRELIHVFAVCCLCPQMINFNNVPSLSDKVPTATMMFTKCKTCEETYKARDNEHKSVYATHISICPDLFIGSRILAVAECISGVDVSFRRINDAIAYSSIGDIFAKYGVGYKISSVSVEEGRLRPYLEGGFR